MKNSSIEWCDHTFNPWIGCTKVSPGSANCYAETLMDTRWGKVKWGKGNPRQRTSAANWKQPVKWNDAAICDACGNVQSICATAGNLGKCKECHEDKMRNPRVFCSSLADWLDEEVPIAWLADLLDLIYRTPNLDWLLLTKRPENWMDRMESAAHHLEGYATHDGVIESVNNWLLPTPCSVWPNVWIGTSVEDQQRADDRIPELLKIPAKVRFLSCEPLLGPVDLDSIIRDMGDGLFGDCLESTHRGLGDTRDFPTIGWVICGGESGHAARPMHPLWVGEIMDSCRTARVPFLFKQWGEWQPIDQPWTQDNPRLKSDSERWMNLEGGHGFHGDNVWRMKRVGKRKAGRILCGQEWNEFPSPRKGLVAP